MTSVLLVEPATYVYVGVDRDFPEFWTTFERFQSFIELNELRVATSSDLLESVSRLFPWSAVDPASRTGMRRINEAARLVLRFLDKYASAPLTDYHGREEKVQFGSGFTNECEPYNDGSVWLAWQDLVAKFALESVSANQQTDMIATGTKASCVEVNVDTLPVHVCESVVVSFVIRRISMAHWPEDHIDPECFKSMVSRRGPGTPSVIFEDTGHQPSRVLKKVLKRVVESSRDLVVSAGTTYHNRFVGDTCKLECSSNPAELEFRLSNGQETLRGVIRTIAKTASEQRTALTVVRRQFKVHCERNGLPGDR